MNLLVAGVLLAITAHTIRTTVDEMPAVIRINTLLMSCHSALVEKNEFISLYQYT